MAQDRKDDQPQPPPSRTSDQALRVGVFLIVGLVATLAVLYTMTEPAMFRGRFLVTTSVPDAGGIRRSDPVQMLGVNVGRVMEFRIGPAGQGVEIELEIEGQYRVPRDSRVRLRSAGALGGMIADIVPGRAPEPLRGGEVLAGVEGEAEGASFDELTSKADDVMARVQGLLSEKMVDDVHASGADLRELLKALSSTVKEQRQQVQGLTASLRRNSESLEKSTGAGELDRAVKRLDEITRKADELTGSLDRTSKSMESILGRIERGEGTLGRLSKDDRLYDSLAEAATSLRQTSLDVGKLIEEIRKNPRKYLKVSVF